MGAMLEWLLRISLVLVIAVAPWLFGGVWLEHQQWLFGAIVVIAGCMLLRYVFAPRSQQSLSCPPPLLALGAGLLLAAIQLIPLGIGEVTASHAIFSELLPQDIRVQTISLLPSATRLQLSRWLLAAMAMVLGAQLFREASSRRFLWWALALNGAAVGVFGVIQRFQWNGLLYWSIPLTQGGQPFASFVNRNNAAGYLNLCLAAACAGILLATRERDEEDSLWRGLHERGSLRWNFETIVLTMCVLLLTLGLAGSFSRGGILAGVAALVVGAFLARHVLGRGIYAIAAIVVFAVPMTLLWLGIDGDLQNRLSTLTREHVQKEARLIHWADTSPALLDFPAGTGLGTYRFGNRPYQNHVTPGWFWNADNQFFEVLIELGPLGLAVVVGFLVIFVRSVFWQTGVDAKTRPRDVTIATTILLVGQVLQSFTDFGITMTSNLLTAAVLVGVLSSIRHDLVEHPRRFDFRPLQLQRGLGAIALAGLIVVGVMALSEIRSAALEESYLRRATAHLEQVESSPVGTQDLLNEGLVVARQRPDSPFPHLMLARLRVAAARQQFVRDLGPPQMTPGQYKAFWAYTTPDRMARTILKATEENNKALLFAFRSHSATRTYLYPALDDLATAAACGAWVPDVHALRGRLAIITTDDHALAIRSLRAAAALRPDSSTESFSSGRLLAMLDDLSTTKVLWKNTLRLAPQLEETVFAAGLEIMTAREFIEECIPQDPVLLVSFAESCTDPLASEHALVRAEAVAQSMPPVSTGWNDWLKGRSATVRKQPDSAIAAYQRAISSEPFRVEWRLELARLYESVGRVDDALAEATKCNRLAPRRQDVQLYLSELLKKRSSVQGAAPREPTAG